MEASLLALGITLYAATLVPLTVGQFARGAALAYLGTVSWGAGLGWSAGLVFAGATLMAALLLATGLGVRIGRSLVATRTHGKGPLRRSSHNT